MFSIAKHEMEKINGEFWGNQPQNLLIYFKGKHIVSFILNSKEKVKPNLFL